MNVDIIQKIKDFQHFWLCLQSFQKKIQIKITVVVTCLFGFYGMSTFLGHVYTYILNIYELKTHFIENIFEQSQFNISHLFALSL